MKYKHKLSLIVLFTIAVITGLLGCNQSSPFKFDKNLLTHDEQQWLLSHPSISVAPSPFWPPIDIMSVTGDYSGISKDYLDIIEKSLGIVFKPSPYTSAETLFDALKNKKVDVASASSPTPERLKYSQFSEAYFNVSVIIIAKSNFKGRVSEKDLDKFKVAIGNQFAAHDVLKNKYPAIEFIPQPSDYEVLSSLVFGDADVAVIDIADASFIMSEKSYNQLKIVGEIEFEYTCRFAVRSDYAPLVSSMNKVLASIPESIKKDIQNRWININTLPIYQEPAFVIAITVIITMILSIVIWNYSLHLQVKRRTAEISLLNSNLERRVEQRTMELESLNEELTALNYELDSHIDQLMTTQAQLVEAEKYASLGKLITGISHKLNTPIGNIFTSLSFQIEFSQKFKEDLLKGLATQDDFQDYIQCNDEVLLNCSRNIEKLKKIITDFKQLEYSSFTTVDTRHFNLYELLAKVITDFKNTKKETIDIHLICPDEFWMDSYYFELEQMLTIIIDNALTHGFKDNHTGTIKVTASPTPTHLDLVIWNNGLVIQEEALSQMFTPFYTTDLQNSSGLGLSVVYNLINHTFNGTINCTSSFESGTEFILHLPLLSQNNK